MAKRHLAAPEDPSRTRCDLEVDSPAWPRPLPLAPSVAEATCVRCLRAVRAAVDSGEEHPPFVGSGPHEPTYGARELTSTGRAAIERSRRGEAPEGRGWPSPEAAVRSYVYARAEGASLRSTSDPSRAHRVQLSRDPSLGGREHAAVDHHRTVAVALDDALADSADALSYACPGLTPAQCLDVYLLVVAGRPKWPHLRRGNNELKQRALQWEGLTTARVVDVVEQDMGLMVTERQVSRIRRHFSGRVQAALIASGEMQAPVEREREDADGGERARTWDPLRRLREQRAVGE